MNWIIKFHRLGINEKLLFFEALFFMYCIKFILIFFPFHRIASISSTLKSKKTNFNATLLYNIKMASSRANKATFWKNKCLTQSLSARFMLQFRKIPSQISLGIIYDKNNKPIAHAWLTCYGKEVVNKNLNYKELVSFA